MPGTRYKRKAISADMAVYSRMMAEDNEEEIHTLKKNLIRALREDVTPRQRQVLFLYYDQGLTMKEIGALLGVDRTTVSRTIKRGENRLYRCLRYGAAALLEPFIRRQCDRNED